MSKPNQSRIHYPNKSVYLQTVPHLISWHPCSPSIPDNPKWQLANMWPSSQYTALYSPHNVSTSQSSPKADESANTTELHLTTIPVVPVFIPLPQTFLELTAYLYTHNSIGLLAFLLLLHIAGSCSLWNIVHVMAEALTVHSLLACTMTVNRIWWNACAYGMWWMLHGKWLLHHFLLR